MQISCKAFQLFEASPVVAHADSDHGLGMEGARKRMGRQELRLAGETRWQRSHGLFGGPPPDLIAMDGYGWQHVIPYTGR